MLTMAIGPEHPGHVRARGFGTTPSTYFNIPLKSSKDTHIKLLLENERKSCEEEHLMFAQQIAAMQGR